MTKSKKAVQKYWDVNPGKQIVHRLADYDGGWVKFGACGDKHMGSRHYRKDVVDALYDLYAANGVTTVFDTGNWIEGESRFNFNELDVHGLEDQVRNFARNHPARQGITTYFVAGDDHEGWYQKKLRIEIGAFAEKIALEMGRTDLRYLGYMEADVALTNGKGRYSWLKVMHPGGGTAYAESYRPQKIAESFQEGEKPAVCLIGHYHKASYGLHRGVHMIQTGCGQDQTSFMRKIPTRAAVGGWIVELNLAPNGTINRIRPEFFPFFNKGFYDGRSRFGQPEAIGKKFELKGGKVQ